MKKIKNKFRIILLIICLLGICYPLTINFINPEITQMQLLIKYYWIYILCTIGMFYSILNINKN